MSYNTRLPIISFIGRPNVGKSTLFNRILRNRTKAMTMDRPGVTRDRHYDIASIDSYDMSDKVDLIIVDTGGFYPDASYVETTKKTIADPFFKEMAEQAKMAIEESDLVLFVVDIREGLLPLDSMIVDHLRRSHKDYWIIVNKYDSDKQMGQEAEFYQFLNSDDSFFLTSAEHNIGLQDLKNRLYTFAKDFQAKENQEKSDMHSLVPKSDVVASLAIIGAPNVGKSTLLNQLVGSQRSLVSNVAGTTVDPIEAYIEIDFKDDAKYFHKIDNIKKSNLDLYQEYLENIQKDEEGELLAFDEIHHDFWQNDDEDIANLSAEESDLEEKKSESRDWLDEAFQELIDQETEVSHDEKSEADQDNLNALEKNFSKSHQEEEEEAILSTKKSLRIVDTAGIRKRSKTSSSVEGLSIYRSLRAISQADVVIIVCDVQKGITHQDRRLCDIALNRGKSLILCLNKTDLMPKIFLNPNEKKEYILDFEAKIPWLGFCRIIDISALKGVRVSLLHKEIIFTLIQRKQKLSTGKLNRVLNQLVEAHTVYPKSSKGKPLKVKYASMVKSSPPTIIAFVNKSLGVPPQYKRYLINGLRKEFGFINTPIHLMFKTTSQMHRKFKKITPSS